MICVIPQIIKSHYLIRDQILLEVTETSICTKRFQKLRTKYTYLGDQKTKVLRGTLAGTI